MTFKVHVIHVVPMVVLVAHPSPDVKTLCNFEPQVWLEFSHHVMPTVLSLKTQGCHVMCWNGVFGRGCDEAEISEKKRLSLNGFQAFSE